MTQWETNKGKNLWDKLSNEIDCDLKEVEPKFNWEEKERYLGETEVLKVLEVETDIVCRASSKGPSKIESK